MESEVRVRRETGIPMRTWVCSLFSQKRTPHPLGILPALLLLSLATFPPFCGAQVWQIDSSPILRIGGLSEDPAYTLSNVVGGLLLEDGRVVLADRFTNGLRVYSSEGQWLLDVGREGEGPGEYEYIRALHRCNGSPIVAFDIHWDMKFYA